MAGPAENRFEAVMDLLDEVVVTMDPSGAIEQFNAAAERNFGYRAAEARGRSVTLLMSDGDAALCQAGIETFRRSAAAPDGGSCREITARRKNGETFPAEMLLHQATAECLVGIIRPLRQGAAAREDEPESELRFRDLDEAASEWFWEADTEYRLVYVSERIGGILGIKPHEVVGYSYFDLGMDDQPAIADAHRATIEAHKPFRNLVFHVGPPGDAKDSKFLRLSGVPVFGADEVFKGYRGVGADVTRWALAEHRAAQAQQQMVDAIESLEDAIAVYDARDHLVACNRAYLDTFGVAGGSIGLGLAFSDILLIARDHGGLDTGGLDFDAWLATRLRDFREASGEPSIERAASGRWFQKRETRTAQGGVVVVLSDITALKEQEEELDRLRLRSQRELEGMVAERTVALEKAQREAFHASRLASVGQLAAGIAHEINTPAQYITNNLQFIGTALAKLSDAIDAGRNLSAQAATQPATAAAAASYDAALASTKASFMLGEAKEAAAEALDGTTRISTIVLSMKEFSHPGGGDSMTPTDLNLALDRTLTVSSNEWKHVAAVEKRFDPAMPMVACHAAAMNQVFLNLIVNAGHAIEASGKRLPGCIVITTSHTGEMAEIRIADTGTGVPPALREKIFDPFFTTKEVGKGTGQGLAISRDVVAKHGGTIEVGGAEGEGAVFTVRLPIRQNAKPS